MKPQYTATSVSTDPETDRTHRMRNYVITMGIRFACLLAIPFVQGWWMVICAIGAVILPYFAVIIANVGNPSAAQAERPEPSAISQGTHTDSRKEPGSNTLIVVDSPVHKSHDEEV
ncbi:DUF3099 domain-containing protein [Lysinibacter sp. HNR]|nr:DUF3099 domain-containing protein [Lysinibacter sp. HNR]WGD38622.1 DUF3099 domain-containing protein [Lysinibacter sp. HNR]